jgi:hypothetical protein
MLYLGIAFGIFVLAVIIAFATESKRTNTI